MFKAMMKKKRTFNMFKNYIMKWKTSKQIGTRRRIASLFGSSVSSQVAEKHNSIKLNYKDHHEPITSRRETFIHKKKWKINKYITSPSPTSPCRDNTLHTKHE